MIVRAEGREILTTNTYGEIMVIPTHKAIVNPENDKTFAIVSKDYTILQHEDALTKVVEEIQKNPEFGQYKQEGPFFYNDGARMETRFVFPEVSIPIRKGDLVNPQVQVLNGYDGCWGFHIIFGAFRIVCSNGLTIGEKVLQVHQRHFKKVNQFLIDGVLSESMHQFSIQTEIWKTWVDKTLTTEEAYQKIDQLNLSKKRVEELRQEVEISEGEVIDGQKILNQWIFFNILCQYATHKVSENIRLDLSNRIRKMF